MRVVLMQPGFMPWQGLFELVAHADRFVFLDDFQFTVKSFDRRNRLFVDKGRVDWYSVPVLSRREPLNETAIDESGKWREQMWRRLRHNYGATPFFDELAPALELWLFSRQASLARLNIEFILLASRLLGLQAEFMYSSQLAAAGRRSQRLASLLEAAGATCYLSAFGSFEYMLEDGVFPLGKVNTLFQNFAPRPYVQAGSPDSFIPYLSVLDALFNIGPAATARLLRNGTAKWLSWEERRAVHNETRGDSADVHYCDQS